MKPGYVNMLLGWLGPAVALLAWLCAVLVQEKPPATAAEEPAARRVLGERWTVGPSHRHENLCVFPVYTDEAPDPTEYLTLDEALEKEQAVISERGGEDAGTPQDPPNVPPPAPNPPAQQQAEEPPAPNQQENLAVQQAVQQVQEQGRGAAVNQLQIENKSDQPLYLLAGEVVLGGQQDRCVARDTIIPPHRQPVPLEVFCVEHGRWSGGTAQFEAAKAIAHPKLRATAQVEKSQSRVWEEVAAKNQALETTSDTGTYRRALRDEKVQEELAGYRDALEPKLAEDVKAVGVVVAVGGKIVCADVFGSPALFHKLWPKLLASYASDALESRREAEKGKAAPKPVTAEDAMAFLQAARKAEATVDHESEAAVTLRWESPEIVGFTTQAQPGGAVVHANVFRKSQ